MSATKQKPKKRCLKSKIDEALYELEDINKETLSIVDRLGVSNKELEDARSEYKRKTSKSRS